MKIKLLKPYGMSPKGAVLPNVNEPIADLLIKRGIAEAVIVVKKKTKKKVSR